MLLLQRGSRLGQQSTWGIYAACSFLKRAFLNTTYALADGNGFDSNRRTGSHPVQMPVQWVESQPQPFSLIAD